MTPSTRHVVIVGGGVIGVCSAYYLAKRGARVTVLERDEIGSGASFGNAGTIAPGHGPVNKPGRIKQALKSMFDQLSPLYVDPRVAPNLAGWLWDFSKACTSTRLQQAMEVLGPLGHESVRLFDQLADEEGLECEYHREGYYEIYLTEEGLKRAMPELDLMRVQGYHPQVLNGDALREREPAIRDTVVGGLYFPEAATLNPHRFVLELAERARRHGATFQTGRPVTGVAIEDGVVRGATLHGGEVIQGDTVLLAAGAYGGPLIRQLGMRFPLQAAKGYHRDRNPSGKGAPPLRVTCMLGERSVFCTPLGGFVRFAGTLEFSGVNEVIRQSRLEQLTNAAKQYLVGVGDQESLSEWCGLRPCVPDGLPAVGPVSRHPGVFVATGHAMLGLTLGPVTGKLMSEWVLDGKPSIDVSALRVDRF